MNSQNTLDRHELSRDKLKIQIKKIVCIEFANFRLHMRFQMPPLQYLMDDQQTKKNGWRKFN